MVFTFPTTVHAAGEGHPSVGWGQNEDPFRLNGTIHRNNATGEKPVKGDDQSLAPALLQVRCRLSAQRSEPVALTGAGEVRRPAASPQAVGERKTDGGNRSLKAAEIPLRSQPDHTTAARATIPPQQHPSLEAIKVGQHKSMPPYHPLTATGTQLGPGPGILSAENKNLLDLRRNKEYQSPVCMGALPRPRLLRGGGFSNTWPPPFHYKQKRPPTRGPSNPTFSLFLSIVSENIPLHLTHINWKSTNALRILRA